MDDFALAPAERALLEALNRQGVRFLIVGMGAAVLEGAPLATQDIDLWFEGVEDPRIGLEPFDVEYRGAVAHQVDGVPVYVLPLHRVIVSKRSTGRPKDLAALPALEATLIARRDEDRS